MFVLTLFINETECLTSGRFAIIHRYYAKSEINAFEYKSLCLDL